MHTFHELVLFSYFVILVHHPVHRTGQDNISDRNRVKRRHWLIHLNHFSKKIEFIATGTGISMNGKVTKSVYCRFSSIWLKYTDSGFKKSSFGSQNKIPIFNRKIRNLMISHTLLSQSIHRLIKHYSILVIIQMSQYSTY